MSLIFASLLVATTAVNPIVTLLNTSNSVNIRVYNEARASVEADARAGKPIQQFVIGVTTDDKALSKKYIEASKPTLQRLAEKTNNPLAWYLLSMESNDFEMLKRAAEGGNVQALNALGSYLTQGALADRRSPTNDIERILKVSFGYFGQAAAKKDTNALINLGSCYQRGLGCERDLVLAFECFQKAARAGHPEGMDYLSACYELGHGTEPNDELSLFWRMRARATRGDKAAEEWLRTRKD